MTDTDKLREQAEVILRDWEAQAGEMDFRNPTRAQIMQEAAVIRAALAAAPQPEVIGRADNMPLADMARAEAFRTLARCIRDPSQPRKMGLPDIAGVLAWEERRIASLVAPQPAPADREALVEVISDLIHNAADAYIEEHDRRAIADALLARCLRLAGGNETIAWAAIGPDGKAEAEAVHHHREIVERDLRDSERIARVAIRVVEGGDDYEA